MQLSDAVIIAIIGMFAAVIGGNGFWDWLKTKSTKQSPTDRLTLAMGRDRLNCLCKKHIKDGYIPEDEYESFKEMGEAYINDKGNSRVKKMFEDAMKLPIYYE